MYTTKRGIDTMVMNKSTVCLLSFLCLITLLTVVAAAAPSSLIEVEENDGGSAFVEQWIQPEFVELHEVEVMTNPKKTSRVSTSAGGPQPSTGKVQVVATTTTGPALSSSSSSSSSTSTDAAAAAADIDAYAKKYRRVYKSAAIRAARQLILAKNLEKARELTAQSARNHALTTGGSPTAEPIKKTKHDGAGPARFGHTRFSDLTQEEFKHFFNNVKIDSTPRRKRSSTAAAPTSSKKHRFAVLDAAVDESIHQLPKTATPPPPPPPKAPTAPGGGAGRFSEVTSSQFHATFHTNDQNMLQCYYNSTDIQAIRAAALVAPTVSYSSFNDFIDAPVDWSGLSPIIRDIGACGACWAATSADLLQTSMFRVTGKPVPQFSYQFMVDCDNEAIGAIGAGATNWMNARTSGVLAASDGKNAGCMGGSLQNSVRFMMSKASSPNSPGQAYWEKDYGTFLPPEDWMSMNMLPQPPCREKPETLTPVIVDFSYAVFPTVITMTSSQDVGNKQTDSTYEDPGHPTLALGAPGSPTEKVDREVLLAQALNKFGPLGIVMDASNLMNYKGGIIDGTMCSSAPADAQHQALLVGLASSGSKQYWVVKNNWGDGWGQNGYMYLQRGGNVCGITSGAIYYNMAGDKNDPVVNLFTQRGLHN